jgi:hypothetical protein
VLLSVCNGFVIHLTGAVDGLFVSRYKFLEFDMFVITGEVFFEHSSEGVTVLHPRIFPKMEEEPELDAGIRHRQLDGVVSSHLDGFR